MPNANGIVLSDMLLIEVLKEQLYNGRAPAWLEKPLTIQKCAKARGWFVGEDRLAHTVTLNVAKPVYVKGRLISKSKALANRDAGQYRAGDEKIMEFNDLMEFLNEKIKPQEAAE